jgi:hypothetical protein
MAAQPCVVQARECQVFTVEAQSTMQGKGPLSIAGRSTALWYYGACGLSSSSHSSVWVAGLWPPSTSSLCAVRERFGEFDAEIDAC